MRSPSMFLELQLEQDRLAASLARDYLHVDTPA
jgi:hypothetical protein